MILFADDATYCEGGSDYIEVISIVNRNLKRLSAWFVANKLSVNLIKTEAMFHTRKNIYFPLSPVLLNETPIAYNYTLKFLGIMVDFKLTWRPHLQLIQRKLSSACGILYNIRNKITIEVARTIYFAIAYPYLNYCTVLWGGAYQTSINKLFITQKKLVRCILRKRRDAPSNPLFRQLNFLKVGEIIKSQIATVKRG